MAKIALMSEKQPESLWRRPKVKFALRLGGVALAFGCLVQQPIDNYAAEKKAASVAIKERTEVREELGYFLGIDWDGEHPEKDAPLKERLEELDPEISRHQENANKHGREILALSLGAVGLGLMAIYAYSRETRESGESVRAPSTNAAIT